MFRHILFFVSAVLLAVSAGADTAAPMQRMQLLLDEVNRGLKYVGQKVDQWIGPGLGLGEEKPAYTTPPQLISARYPVDIAPEVIISNLFDEIRVTTWTERVVQVNAYVTVGADTEAAASEVARGNTPFNVTATEERVEIKTLAPEVPRNAGQVSVGVRYEITVPQGAHVITDNFFGDTIISGVRGMVAAEAQYGLLELVDLGGPVKVRSHGDFPVRAQGLALGGDFELHGAQAEFSGIQGQLRVSSFRGSITLRDIGPDARLDVDNDSGPIFLLLPPDANPDLSAAALYGDITSSLIVDRATRSNRVVARHLAPDSRQRIVLSTSFADITVQYASRPGGPPVPVTTNTTTVTDTITRNEPVADATVLAIDAIDGDVTVQGTDEDVVRVTANLLVWVPKVEQAPPGIQALQLNVQRNGQRLMVSTAATRDMASLNVSDYAVHLLVQCPRRLLVEVLAKDGRTTVSGLDQAVQVTQGLGDIMANGTHGPLTLSNQNGSITVADTTGPATVSARYNAIRVERVVGAVFASNVQGQTIIEAPRAESVSVRSTGGDVRILAFEGIGGPYDVEVQDGNISMLLPLEANAHVQLEARGGLITTQVPMVGSKDAQSERMEASLGSASPEVELTTEDGNIVVDLPRRDEPETAPAPPAPSAPAPVEPAPAPAPEPAPAPAQLPEAAPAPPPPLPQPESAAGVLPAVAR